MTGNELREKFIDFFTKKGHAIVPSSSLIPDDPSVLLTSAGMQQFKSYYTGKLDPMTVIHATTGKPLGARNIVTIQKCFRTSDIDEVGDESHLTFLEMLGNFSFGGSATSGVEGYFKKEAIAYAHAFITKELKLEISYVTVLGAREFGLFDEESRAIWDELGITDIRNDTMENVFWGPTGNEGPCGPSTEIYCKNAAGTDVEIWNIVFNEYFCSGSREELLGGRTAKLLEKLKVPGVDTGMGLERLAMIVQKKSNIFETDLFKPIVEKIDLKIPGRDDERSRRIIADHVRGVVFLLADGVRPSNKGAGYVLRRLMRRIIFHGVEDAMLYDAVIENYRDFKDFYDKLAPNREAILNVATNEYEKFIDAMRKGLRELEKMNEVDARMAFQLYESFGLPYEAIKDFDGGKRARKVTRVSFDEEFKKHQEISRAGAEKKFGGHGLLLDTGELKARNEAELQKVTRLHTATHLLHASLRKILGESVRQMGSDIAAERTRFDFSFSRKLTDDERQKIEELVNDVIKKGYDVTMQEMPYQEAIKHGALHFFREKYPELVKVYSEGIFLLNFAAGRM